MLVYGFEHANNVCLKRDIRSHRDGAAPETPDLISEPLGGFVVAPVIDAYCISLFRCLPCCSCTDPTGAPCHNNDFVHGS